MAERTLEEMRADLVQLKKVWASGALEVTTDGKRVKYDDSNGLLRRIRAVESEIAAAEGDPLPQSRFATFRRT